MYNRKKERLYISDILDDPALTFPSYYMLSHSMRSNEMLLSAIEMLHRFDFSHYTRPYSYKDIFTMLNSGGFPIFRERYIIGYFGGKMMYLEPSGWKSVVVTEAIFDTEQWLVY